MADTPVMYKSDLEDVDTAMYDYINERFNLFYKEGGVNQTRVPVIYLTNERSFQIKSDLDIRDADERLILPIVTINRTSVVKDPNRKGGFQAHYYANDSSGNVGRREVLRRIKQNKTSDLSNALSQKEEELSRLLVILIIGVLKEVIYEVFTAPIPIYVNVDYKITLMTEYIQEMNSLVQPFMTRTGQINSFVMRRNGHLYEAFIDQNFSQENNVSNLAEDERRFKTEITIKVIAPLVGEGENDNKNLIEKKRNCCSVLLPF